MCYTAYVILVNIGKGKIITVGYGDIEIKTYTTASIRLVRFYKVLYVPELSTNLLLTKSLRQKGVFYRSDRQQLFIKYTDSVDIVLADVYSYNGLLYLALELLATALTAMITSKTIKKAEATMLI